MAIIRWLLFGGVGSYALVVGVLYAGQRSLLYHPIAIRISPAEAGLLFALANEPKRFVRFDKGGHIDLDDYGAGDVARAFIAEPDRNRSPD